jgi:hypothetical protein
MPEPGVDSLDFSGERMTTPRVAEEASRSGVTHWLLDVSTKSDQFGVAIGKHHEQISAIRDGELQWNGHDILVFTVPAIQWEPVSDRLCGRSTTEAHPRSPWTRFTCSSRADRGCESADRRVPEWRIRPCFDHAAFRHSCHRPLY